MDMSLSKVGEIVKDREAWPDAVHGGGKESDTTQQLNSHIYIHTHTHVIYRIYPTFALNRELVPYDVKTEIFKNRLCEYVCIHPSAMDCPSWV